MKFLAFIFVVLLSLLPVRAGAVIAVAQSVSASVEGATDLTTGDLTTSASGSLFICDQFAYAASATSVVVADSKSNIYAYALYIGSAYDDSIQGGQWYKENGTGGATHNWTVTYDVSSRQAIICKEVTGALTSGALDQSASKVDNDPEVTTGISSDSTPTTTQNDELWSGAGASYAATPANFVAQSGFTEDTQVNAIIGIISASKAVSSTGAALFTFDTDQTSVATLAWVTTWKAIVSGVTVAQRRIISAD